MRTAFSDDPATGYDLAELRRQMTRIADELAAIRSTMGRAEARADSRQITRSIIWWNVVVFLIVAGLVGVVLLAAGLD
jgi:hypothetical protein